MFLRTYFRSLNKNVHLLFLCQALAGTATSLVVTTTALAAQTIAPDKALVTLPFALQFVGMMVSTAPASMLMRRIGRRAGFALAATVLVAAGLLSAYALAVRSFPLFCLGGAMIGTFTASAMYYRFTAAEVAAEANRSRAISYVLAGGVVSALCGPTLAVWARDTIGQVPFAGSFLALACVGLATLAVVRYLEVPPLKPEERHSSGRPLAEIMRQPVFAVALLGAMFAYFGMNLVMTSTPLAMRDCGYPYGDAALVIQWHVVGMYAPAFVMGHLIHRFGALHIMAAGVVLMLACLAIDLTGISVGHFWFALLLLGVGWSCLFIGATNLLTYAYLPAERSKVQAVNETAVFALVAMGSLGSGLLQNIFGWSAVNLAILPGLIIVAISIAWLKLRRLAPALRAS